MEENYLNSKMNLFIKSEQHRWSKGWCTHLGCGRSWARVTIRQCLILSVVKLNVHESFLTKLWYFVLVELLFCSLFLCMLFRIRLFLFLEYMLSTWDLRMSTGPSWPWSYGSWINYYLCNQCLFPLPSWIRILLRRGVLDATLCDKVWQWLEAGLLRLLRIPPPIKLTATI